VEDGAHAFELIGDLAALFFAPVGSHNEMWTGDLNPILLLRVCDAEQGRDEKQGGYNLAWNHGRAPEGSEHGAGIITAAFLGVKNVLEASVEVRLKAGRPLARHPERLL